jgi:hypothetical protein
MALVNPTAMVSQMSVQLAACSSWGGTTADHFYPEVDWSAVSTRAAVLSDTRSLEPYAAGAAGIKSGVISIQLIHTTYTIGQLEDFAQDILDEILTATSGIPFLSGECGLSSDVQEAETAGGTAHRSTVLTLPYGLRV